VDSRIAPVSQGGSNENLTLSDAQLATCEPITGEGGKALRGYCPFHGSDTQRSLRINVKTGHFKRHSCGTIDVSWYEHP
jgi:hypothetical protein